MDLETPHSFAESFGADKGFKRDRLPKKGRIDHCLVEEGNDTDAAARVCRTCVELGPPFFKWASFDAVQVFAKHELGEESEAKVPEAVM